MERSKLPSFPYSTLCPWCPGRPSSVVEKNKQHIWRNHTGCYNTQSESDVAQSCPTLCDPLDCSPPGSSVHGILQARILEWVVTSSSRGSSQPRDQTHVSCVACIGRWMLYHWATWEDCIYIWLTYSTQIQTIHLIYEHVIGWKYNWRIAEWLSAEKEWAASI